jgi:hypothetical protein
MKAWTYLCGAALIAGMLAILRAQQLLVQCLEARLQIRHLRLSLAPPRGLLLHLPCQLRRGGLLPADQLGEHGLGLLQQIAQ